MCINTDPKNLSPTARLDCVSHCANTELKMLCVGERTETGQKQRVGNQTWESTAHCDKAELKRYNFLLFLFFFNFLNFFF